MYMCICLHAFTFAAGCIKRLKENSPGGGKLPALIFQGSSDRMHVAHGEGYWRQTSLSLAFRVIVIGDSADFTIVYDEKHFIWFAIFAIWPLVANLKS